LQNKEKVNFCDERREEFYIINDLFVKTELATKLSLVDRIKQLEEQETANKDASDPQ
jgi:BMFP domain-containing protein YqiC